MSSAERVDGARAGPRFPETPANTDDGEFQRSVRAGGTKNRASARAARARCLLGVAVELIAEPGVELANQLVGGLWVLEVERLSDRVETLVVQVVHA